jgi:hypothetical protein
LTTIRIFKGAVLPAPSWGRIVPDDNDADTDRGG